MRIRGMWHIANPNKIFDYIYKYDEETTFQLIALIKLDKYNSLPKDDRDSIESLSEVDIIDIKIKNPNNPI